MSFPVAFRVQVQSSITKRGRRASHNCHWSQTLGLWLKLFSEAALPVFHDKKISQNDTKCQFPLRLAKNSSKVQVATMHVTNCTIIALFRSHFRFSSIDYPEYTMSMCPKTWELRHKLFFKSDNVCLMVSSNH